MKYLKDGHFHRLDGPAVEYSDGSLWWYRNGLLHRADGPALELLNGDKNWFLLDIKMTKQDFNSWIERVKIFNFSLNYLKNHHIYKDMIGKI